MLPFVFSDIGLLTSWEFVVFVAVALAVYYVLPRRPQNLWLLGLSYAFYVAIAATFAVVLLVVSAANFALGQALQLGEKKEKRWLLWLGIILNLLMLLYFKYADFYVPELRSLLMSLGLSADGLASITIRIVFPIGMSYYVLEMISYLVDTHRRQVTATTNFADFALYAAYFPKMLSGPIERAKTFLPKLAEPRVVDNQLMTRSLMLLVLGLVRKTIFADLLIVLIPPNFIGAADAFATSDLVLYIVASCVFLYNDFAGYTNIVRGISGLFGIELTRNFDTPFFIRNFTEGWERWHISLSRWLRDYVYFPLSRALLRRNPKARALNIIAPSMATMIISALWHQVSLSMLVWGSMNGIYLLSERLPTIRGRTVTPLQERPIWRQVVGNALTLTVGLTAFVFFTADSIAAALMFLGNMLNLSMAAPDGRILVIMTISLVLDALQRRWGEFVFVQGPRLVQASLLAGAALILLLRALTDLQATPFIYQGF
ncbi:MAG: MBOAT family protein [Chloroflexi bacterium]|nr:MBOAT family protein [Chloroflexota bacterium]